MSFCITATLPRSSHRNGGARPLIPPPRRLYATLSPPCESPQGRLCFFAVRLTALFCPLTRLQGVSMRGTVLSYAHPQSKCLGTRLFIIYITNLFRPHRRGIPVDGIWPPLYTLVTVDTRSFYPALHSSSGS